MGRFLGESNSSPVFLTIESTYFQKAGNEEVAFILEFKETRSQFRSLFLKDYIKYTCFVSLQCIDDSRNHEQSYM